MKTYTIIFAEDIPHYGVVELEARNQKSALAKAKAHWRAVRLGLEPYPLTDAEFGNAINSRIVMITGDGGEELVTDIHLDKPKTIAGAA